MKVIVRPIIVLPPAVNHLAQEAFDEGFTFVKTMLSEWQNGQRFTGRGEQLFGAFFGDSLVAIGGIMQDPYLDDPEIGRVRRFFVARNFRRQGIGHQLLKVIVSQAADYFRRITLRTYTQEGAKFYESAGFTPTDLPDCSHEYVV